MIFDDDFDPNPVENQQALLVSNCEIHRSPDLKTNELVSIWVFVFKMKLYIYCEEHTV